MRSLNLSPTIIGSQTAILFFSRSVDRRGDLSCDGFPLSHRPGQGAVAEATVGRTGLQIGLDGLAPAGRHRRAGTCGTEERFEVCVPGIGSP